MGVVETRADTYSEFVVRQFKANAEFAGCTDIQSVAKLGLTKRNVVDWGGESVHDQRLSGLARERSERTQCPI